MVKKLENIFVKVLLQAWFSLRFYLSISQNSVSSHQRFFAYTRVFDALFFHTQHSFSNHWGEWWEPSLHLNWSTFIYFNSGRYLWDNWRIPLDTRYPGCINTKKFRKTKVSFRIKIFKTTRISFKTKITLCETLVLIQPGHKVSKIFRLLS